ncbi:MAG: alpha/beta hydrolase, partial [Bacteroidota bacterium]
SIESHQFLPGIRRPTLLVNAYNDPMLSPACFNDSLAKDHPFLTYERTRKGGHVGYMTRMDTCWAEARALAFARALVS